MGHGYRSRCRGRACSSDGRQGRGENIGGACENPVNPIPLGSASPLALQVRMGAGTHDAAYGRSSVASVPQAPVKGLEECRSRFFCHAPAPMSYTLGLKHSTSLSTPSLLTAVVNHEPCAEGCFLGLLAISSTLRVSALRLKNWSRPCIAVNHAFTWPGPRSDASSAG